MGNSNEGGNKEKYSIEKGDPTAKYPIDVIVYGEVFDLFLKSINGNGINQKEFAQCELQWTFTRVNREDIVPLLAAESFNGNQAKSEPGNKAESNQVKPKENVVVVYQTNTIRCPEVANLLKEINQLSVDYHPFIIFITSTVEETTSQFRQLYQQDLTDFDIRNISIAHLVHNDIQEVFLELIRISAYYHQLGDEVYIPSSLAFKGLSGLHYESELNAKPKLCLIKDSFSFRINFLVIGRPGAGKSTFINAILGEKRSKQMTGKSVTSRVIAYKHRLYPIILIDTPGMESEICVDKTFELIKSLSVSLGNEDNLFIHMVIYLNSCQDKRTFYNTEVNLLLKYHQWNQGNEVELIFVNTHALNSQQSKKKVEFLNADLRGILDPNKEYTDKIFPVELVDDPQFPSFGMGRLFEYLYSSFQSKLIGPEVLFIYSLPVSQEQAIYQVLSKYKEFNRLRSFEEVLSNCKRKAKRAIEMSIGFIREISLSLLRMNEIAFVNFLFVELARKIGIVYGLTFGEEELNELFKAEVAKGSSNLFGYSLENMDAIEGAGMIGCEIIEMCEKRMKQEGVKLFFLNEINHYNNAINSLKLQMKRLKY